VVRGIEWGGLIIHEADMFCGARARKPLTWTPPTVKGRKVGGYGIRCRPLIWACLDQLLRSMLLLFE
jgi:hypothetical protein